MGTSTRPDVDSDTLRLDLPRSIGFDHRVEDLPAQGSGDKSTGRVPNPQVVL